MNLAWVTDIHLNFLSPKERYAFYKTILDYGPDAVMISGDIAEAIDVEDILNEMAESLKIPLYFVLGNHDFYRSSVVCVRSKLITRTHNLLQYLTVIGVQSLTADTLLVGVDGFADARYGNYKESHVQLNDSRYIKELSEARLSDFGEVRQSAHLQLKMQALADEDARQLEHHLETALQQLPKTILVCTHVPPFPEASYYRGRQSDDNFLPFYASKATGDVLLEVAKASPDVNFQVFCGHTHGEAFAQMLSNLIVTAGESEYRYPTVQKIIKV